MNNFYIKTNRTFSPIRKYGWIFTLTVAFGGLWLPKLGLLVLPVILALTTLSFFKGRYWCGNFCPHGSLFDSLLMGVSKNRRIPKFIKSKTFAALFLIFFGFNITRKIIKASAVFGTYPFWDKLGFIFVASYLMVTVAGGLLTLVISQRTWCHFCPMGSMQMLSYKLGRLLGVAKITDEKITVAHKDLCHSCGKCYRVCPMQLAPYQEFSEENQFDHSKCIRCKTCVVNCPAGVLELSSRKQALLTSENVSLEGYEDRQKISAVIERIRELKEDVREIRFRFLSPERVDYQAGQFILVQIQKEPVLFRAYSISSFNEDGTGLSVTVKKAPQGYGTDIVFNQFSVGEKIQLEGPMGGELLVDKEAEKVVFVAGGIGITPFVPLVQEMTQKDNKVKEVHLVYGVNKEQELMYDEYFEEMKKTNPKFRYHKVVASDDSWKGRRGFVTDILKEMELEGSKVYMCGPKPMINPTVKQLQSQGVKEEDIFFESA